MAICYIKSVPWKYRCDTNLFRIFFEKQKTCVSACLIPTCSYNSILVIYRVFVSFLLSCLSSSSPFSFSRLVSLSLSLFEMRTLVVASDNNFGCGIFVKVCITLIRRTIGRVFAQKYLKLYPPTMETDTETAESFFNLNFYMYRVERKVCPWLS